MGNKRWTRLIALAMAVVCTLTVAAAVSFDQNGDGKITVWDLQALVGKSDYDATVRQMLGGGDELNPNADGAYEIWTELGLRNMVKNAAKGYSFKLMADFDLKGADWTPIKSFKGTFDGNNHTISNFTITKSASTTDVGFFGVVDHIGKDAEGNTLQATVKNLNLRNVNVVATEGSQYIGLLTGQNRGVIENCTTVGTVTDTRTKLDKNVYVGAIAGRNNNSKPDGIIIGTNGLDVEVNITEASKDFKKPSQKVNSKMATFFTALSADSTGKRDVGIAGNSDKADIQNKSTGKTGDLLWQDLTSSTDLAPQVLQDRREAAAALMYEMCTVEWTPSTEYAVDYDSGPELRYYRYDGAEGAATNIASRYWAGGIWVAGTWYPGGVYRGIPYNHGASNIDRFLSVMDVKNGIYTTNASLPATAYYITDPAAKDEINAAFQAGKLGTTTASGYTVPKDMKEALTYGDTQWEGNNVGFNQYIGADCASQAGWAWKKISAVGSSTGWVNPQSTTHLYPMTSNITTYGIQAVNGMVFDNPGDADGDGDKNDSGDKCVYMSNYLEQNTDYWMDTLAKTSKGDFLMEYSFAGGHTRVALSDAVVIRTYDGKVDANMSYIVTAEQGGSGADSDGVDRYIDITAKPVWRSSCCVDRRMTFADLTTNTKAEDGYYRAWAPITCDALRNADSAAGTVKVDMDASGKVTSNFQIVSTTVNGKTEYTGIGQTHSRLRVTSKTLTGNTGDTVIVRLANGKDYTGKIGTAGLTEVK